MHKAYQRESSSSRRHKFKFSVCCFTGTHHQPLQNEDLCYTEIHPSNTPTTPPTPFYLTFRNRSVISWIARKHHRQTPSPDFTYDPSSYALNFEDESRADDHDFPFRDFASRLSASPPSIRKTHPSRSPLLLYS